MITPICAKHNCQKVQVKDSSSKKGWNWRCKICLQENKKKYYIQHKDIKILENKRYREEHQEFFKEYNQKYRQTHKEYFKEYDAAYRLENKEKIKIREKQYAETNKEIRRESKRKYEADRRSSDPAYRLRQNFSNAINYSLKKKRSSKNKKSIFDYLPYSFEEFCANLESKFSSWMNWENQGRYDCKTWNDDDSSTWTWQIDHIEPVADFVFTSPEDDEFQRAWALSNLRPLAAKQNILDGTRKTRHKQTKLNR